MLSVSSWEEFKEVKDRHDMVVVVSGDLYSLVHVTDRFCLDELFRLVPRASELGTIRLFNRLSWHWYLERCKEANNGSWPRVWELPQEAIEQKWGTHGFTRPRLPDHERLLVRLYP